MRSSTVGFVGNQVTVHVYLVLGKIFSQSNIVLLFIGLHSPLKAIVVADSFGSHSNLVIVEKLDALHVVLEAAIGELRHVELIRKSQLLDMGRKYSQITLFIIFV